MAVFLLIVQNIMFPLFVLVGLGAYLHRKFSFDLNTLSKLNTYFFLPAVSFTNLYKGDLTAGLVIQVLGFSVLLNLFLIGISGIIAKVGGFEPKLRATFQNSLVLSNSGNFGLPVSELVFHSNPLGVAIQVIISIFQNLLTFTYGLYNMVSVKSNGKKILLDMLRLPVLQAVIVAVLLRSFHIELPAMVWKPIESISNAFTATALVTLGAQVAYLQLKQISPSIFVSVFGRLVLSPTIAFLIIFSLDLHGTLAQALFIASSFPTSRNSALLALEYENHPDYATQVVLLTTILSGITVTAVVYLATFL